MNPIKLGYTNPVEALTKTEISKVEVLELTGDDQPPIRG